MYPIFVAVPQFLQVVIYDFYKRVQNTFFVVMVDAVVVTINAFFIRSCRIKEIFSYILA